MNFSDVWLLKVKNRLTTYQSSVKNTVISEFESALSGKAYTITHELVSTIEVIADARWNVIKYRKNWELNIIVFRLILNTY